MQQQDDTAAPATKQDLAKLEQTVNAQFMEVFKYMDRRFEEMKQYMDQKQAETFQHVGVLMETQKHDIISSTNDNISLLDDRVKGLEVHTGLGAA
jgi:hypothetical protein